ncbi:MAG TPA: aspartate/glutamate racemase family protein [Xanthobacteraceae bacterium]|jgi:aspartate racemase|nr:aspartate/glutamate racemase family protein [Xanthobacteraceae bacterium]
MHIGLIGGIGPAATDYYCRGLIEGHAAVGRRLDLTIAHADVRELVANQGEDRRAAQAAAFLPLVKRLQAAGAQAAAVTSMGGHFCIRELEAQSPLPIVNVLDALDAAIAARRHATVGLIGNRMVMDTRAYGRITTAQVLLPDEPEREAVHRAYREMAVPGRVTPAQREVFFAAGRALKARGAEAIVLGGTDLFLAFDGADCGFATLDCARVHVEAILACAFGER